MSSKAGPSSASKSKSKGEKKVPKVTEPIKSKMSNETVDSEDDLESRESSSDLDSEEDLEDVQPKHKSTGQANGSRTSGRSGSEYP
jgi:hypothetical protein